VRIGGGAVRCGDLRLITVSIRHVTASRNDGTSGEPGPSLRAHRDAIRCHVGGGGAMERV
jgi:hypothetical protein